MKSLKECRVIYRNKTQIWKLDQILKLDRNRVLEFKNGLVWLRDFGQKAGVRGSLISMPYSPGQGTVTFSVSDSLKLVLMPSIYPEAAQALRASGLQVQRTYGNTILSADDQLIQKSMKRILGSIVTACCLILMVQLSETEPETKEEVIPKKYAKLILQKPKSTPSERVAGASSSQQTAKTVAKAFQSKTVQKSIQKILQGGLSRYSALSTGRSIQSLSQMTQTKAAQSSLGLSQKSESMLAQASGQYGSSEAAKISGQGTGKIDIGLNYHDALVEEGLTKEEVAKVIHSHMSEIRYCYESAILADPSLAGKVLVDFKISSKGGVAIANAVENTMKSMQVGGCLITKLKGWKFPEPRGGVQVAVTYPFIFKSMNR